MRAWPAVVAAALFASSVAHADYVPPSNDSEEPEVGEEPAPKPGKRKFYVVAVEEVERPTRHVTVTFEPLHLFYPIVQIGVEARVADEVGVMIFGGGGSAPVDFVSPPYTGPSKVSVWEVGGQLLYYATGDFGDGGMQVGVEALFMHAALEGASALGTGSIGGLAAGFTVGPLIGWKFVTRGGFTVDSQIGVGFRATKQTTGDPAAPSDDRSAVLLGSLAIGWTF
jgi:hypothetical protein